MAQAFNASMEGRGRQPCMSGFETNLAYTTSFYRDPVPLSPQNNELISLRNLEEISSLNNVEAETQLLLTNIYSGLR